MDIDIYSEIMEKEVSNSSEQITDYDDIAQRYDIIEKSDVTLWHLGYRKLLSQIEPIVNKSILDYGCGSGTFCRLLYESKAVVTGADTSVNMINVAKKGDQDDIDYYHITSGNLDFLEADSFDIVVLNFVLCTVTTWHEIFNILNSIQRVLKNNGSMLILNPNWDKSNGKEFLSFKMQYCENLSSGIPVTSVIKTEPPIYLNDYYWSQEDYCTYLTKTGFKNCVINEPLATGEEFPWIHEKSYPPYYIIEAKK
jgi:ubiquinone/menaquinone biosynthesis C-methylase UbiE